MNLLYCTLITLFLSTFTATAQTAERDSSIHVGSSRLYRMGQSLVVSMRIDITRNLPSNESVELIPQLSDSLGNFVQLPSVYVNGRRQHLFFHRETARHAKKGYEEIRRRNGQPQSVSYLRSVAYSPWMRHASLDLVEKACGCGVPHSVSSAYLTRLNLLPDIRPQVAFITPQVEERKLREESGRAYLDFPLNETTIYPDYRNNPAELAKISRSIDLVKNDTNVVISCIGIHGYASPEGPYKNNDRLARERTRTLKEHVCSRYAFSDTLLTTRYTAEDWDGFVRLLSDTALSDSILPHRAELLRIATGKDAPDRKEQKMRRRYPADFAFILEEWMPALRHSDYTIHYVVRPFTVEQARRVFADNPKNLSIEEMFRIAQTCEEGSTEYNDIFMTAVRLNPDNPVANLNAACISFLQGDVKSGRLYLEKAEDSPQKTLLQGIVCMMEGNYDEAESLFQQAREAGLTEAADGNLRLLHEIY
ncbi:MAG: DUF3868 domain-containing protein [Bacteroides sp.]|nr:DUF3868 domain-containing protein [Bacteroides sp.]